MTSLLLLIINFPWTGRSAALECLRQIKILEGRNPSAAVTLYLQNVEKDGQERRRRIIELKHLRNADFISNSKAAERVRRFPPDLGGFRFKGYLCSSPLTVPAI